MSQPTPANDDKYINGSQQRLLQVIQRLAGHEVFGLGVPELAKALSANATNVYRDLVNLRAAGLAEQTEEGKWRLGPRLPQISLAFMEHLERCERRVAELRQRYTRTA